MKIRLSPLSWSLGCLVFFGRLQSAATPAGQADDYVPAKVHQGAGVKFPARALHEGLVRGDASLMVEVRPDGQLGDVLPFAHSGIDFAVAAIEAVKQWEFTPAWIDGEPVRSIITINVQFEVNGVTAYTKLIGQERERPTADNGYSFRPFSLAELDQMPAALSRRRPVYLEEWIQQGRTGAVVVDFFIDANGHTRFARVVGNADEMLAAAAVDAVKTWQFEPPTRLGRPVLAQARQVIRFEPEQ